MLVPYVVLCLFSIVMVYSASGDYIHMQMGLSTTAYMWKQMVFVAVGFVLCGLTFMLKLKLLRKPGLLGGGMLVTIGLLVYLLIKGKVNPSSAINGASSWIPVGPINIQPSEIAKLLLVLYLAHMFTRRERDLNPGSLMGSAKVLRAPLLMVMVILALVLLQPDTGGAAILMTIIFVMVFASGLRWQMGLGFIALGFGVLGGGYYLLITRMHGFLATHYQGRRLLAVLHPFAMQRVEGKQLVNSMYAINHGGLFGVGLGNGTIKLGYLPEPYTDFILSVITEELGILGGIIVVGMIFFIVWRTMLVGIRARSTYKALLMYGIATMLFVQTTFNVGGVVGVLPITGVTLPFISYGGSSLLILSVAIGIVLNVSATEKRDRLAGVTASGQLDVR
ncbi:cell cycle family protein [Lacticaseibacillus thailandensis DSM 22698 = JCM 13996]|uniref:Probable peptidoglycan glycosyltransferase FtsW n=1 Tax=Lacticaseibacillus thailandensis DSM 22698 = JCM 13996 TaxID=1423810 RepID=A0A0R2CJT1_9LACO|nr:cell cycle family protein [Lacticaseibacillus thailandensis DSM 22698 = JCM 13996]